MKEHTPQKHEHRRTEEPMETCERHAEHHRKRTKRTLFGGGLSVLLVLVAIIALTATPVQVQAVTQSQGMDIGQYVTAPPTIEATTGAIDGYTLKATGLASGYGYEGFAGYQALAESVERDAVGVGFDGLSSPAGFTPFVFTAVETTDVGTHFAYDYLLTTGSSGGLAYTDSYTAGTQFAELTDIAVTRTRTEEAIAGQLETIETASPPIVAQQTLATTTGIMTEYGAQQFWDVSGNH